MTLFDALDLAWLDGAACARVREPLWFGDREADKRAAVRICGGCPVRVECWQASERRNERIGIWAGVERGWARHQLRCPSCGCEKPGRDTAHRWERCGTCVDLERRDRADRAFRELRRTWEPRSVSGAKGME
jgi:hypothetical protein